MLWGGSEGGELELELHLDDNSCHDDGVGPGRGNAVTVGIIIKSRAISDSIWRHSLD